MQNEEARFARPDVVAAAEMGKVDVLVITQIGAGVAPNRQLLDKDHLAGGDIIIV